MTSKPGNASLAGVEIYHNPRSAKQCDNVAMFRKIADRFPWMEFYQPNPDKAPWHWQTVVRYAGGDYGVVLNFWPHKGRAMREDCKPVDGYSDIRGMIAEAIDDSAEPFEVIEVIE